jgi:hypothetical protein
MILPALRDKYSLTKYHLYRILEHMNDNHRASFKEIESYLETLGF